MVTARGRELEEGDFAFLRSLSAASGFVIPPNMSLQNLERQAIVTTLDRLNGNVKETAAILGIDRSTLYEKIKKYEIPR
jgi:transcriptional regulator of acetoin/glycerol metabolism